MDPEPLGKAPRLITAQERIECLAAFFLQRPRKRLKFSIKSFREKDIHGAVSAALFFHEFVDVTQGFAAAFDPRHRLGLSLSKELLPLRLRELHRRLGFLDINTALAVV